ncbi:MAG TPA: hypothetical protein VHR86_00660 [Armatimonadota bacterium]|nr:hypothetical protein [Armatimonadota bacterium]
MENTPQGVTSAATEEATAEPFLCPYLGRRQHPTEAYPYATSHNVCYARPRGDGRPYSHVAQHDQVAHCLEAVDGWATCRLFAKASAAGVTAPRPIPAHLGEQQGVRVQRRRRRVRKHYYRALVKRILFAALVLGGSALLGLLIAQFATR